MTDRDQRIRERAYLIWERAGRPPGRGEEFWFLAAREIDGEGAAPTATTPAEGEVSLEAPKSKRPKAAKATDSDAPRKKAKLAEAETVPDTQDPKKKKKTKKS